MTTKEDDAQTAQDNRQSRKAVAAINKGKGKPSDDFPMPTKKTRVKDGALILFDGRLVNRQCMADILKCRPSLISKMIRRPDGLPHIRMGARYWFDPEAVLAWFKEQQTQANPSRVKRPSPKQ